MVDEEKLIVDGIIWLSKFYGYRNLETNKANGKCVQYSQTQDRVIRRVKDFIQRNPENLDKFNDLLMGIGKNLHKDVFILFMKLWSRQYKENHPIGKL